MATTFLEPGGDATFNVAEPIHGGLWSAVISAGGTPTIGTDFIHGGHLKSIKYAKDGNFVQANFLATAGSRVSVYFYFNSLPSATSVFMAATDGGSGGVELKITSTGILQMARWDTDAQIGTNGATLTTGQWYRISLAYTITSTTLNRFELFVNGVSSISITNATIGATGATQWWIGNISGDTSLDFRSSDHYADNSNSLTDTGDIWVTAKRPNANGTTNGFSTQIGSGGSGYGSGHSPQVNERALSTTNGWSMIGVGSAITEEYNIESSTTGDIDISTATIVDWLGWVSIKSLAGETVNMILNGASVAQAITTTITLYTKIKGSSTYPVGTGADIGITTDTSLTTVSLYECGVIVAYIPAGVSVNKGLLDFF